MEVEVKVELSLVTAKPPLKALADVTLCLERNEVAIHRCAVFHKPGEPPWATLPRLPLERNGKRTFVPLIILPRPLHQRVLDAILTEYQRQTSAR